MKRYKLAIMLLGVLSMLQAIGPKSTLEAQLTKSAAHSSSDVTNFAIPLDEALITIDGLCDDLANGKEKSSTCQTVITRSEFERLVDAVQPNMPSRGRREFAESYAD